MNKVVRQSGMTTIGWLLVLMLVGFFALVMVRLAPAYLEYFSVAAIVDSLREEPFISQKPIDEIRKMIRRRFDMNNIKTIKATQVKIDRVGNGLTITADYEVRGPLIANVDVVTKFYKQVEIPAR